MPRNIDYLSLAECDVLVKHLFPLKDVVENNDWHIHESVYDHTFRVMLNLLQLLDDVPKLISEYLTQKVGNRSKENLLLISTLLHDIGKKDTYVSNGEKTQTPLHEQQSAVDSLQIADELFLTQGEMAFLYDVIAAHGEFSDIIDPNRSNYEERLILFREQMADRFLSLALLGLADLLGSQWEQSNPTDFLIRKDRCVKILEQG